MPRKIIRINGRLFVRGKAECMACDTKFKYLLPVDVMPFWEQFCSECSLAFPDDMPNPGQIVIQDITFL